MGDTSDRAICFFFFERTKIIIRVVTLEENKTRICRVQVRVKVHPTSWVCILICSGMRDHIDQDLLWTHSGAPIEATTFWPLWWRLPLYTRTYHAKLGRFIYLGEGHEILGRVPMEGPGILISYFGSSVFLTSFTFGLSVDFLSVAWSLCKDEFCIFTPLTFRVPFPPTDWKQKWPKASVTFILFFY